MKNYFVMSQAYRFLYVWSEASNISKFLSNGYYEHIVVHI